jgi:hypothetical protein
MAINFSKLPSRAAIFAQEAAKATGANNGDSYNKSRAALMQNIQSQQTPYPIQGYGDGLANMFSKIGQAYFGAKDIEQQQSDDADAANTRSMAMKGYTDAFNKPNETSSDGGKTWQPVPLEQQQQRADSILQENAPDVYNKMEYADIARSQALSDAAQENKIKLDFEREKFAQRTPLMVDRSNAMIPSKVNEAYALNAPKALGAGMMAAATEPYKTRTAAAGANNINMVTNTADSFSNNFGKALGSEQAKQYVALEQQVIKNKQEIPLLEAALEFSKNPNVYQGTMGEAAKDVKRTLNSLGITEFNDLPDTELFGKQSQRVANAILMENKGVQTEGDAKRALGIVFSLNSQPETNQRLIQQRINEIDYTKNLYDQASQSYRQGINANDPTQIIGLGQNAINNTPPVKNNLSQPQTDDISLSIPRTVETVEDVANLPEGATFITPTGETRIKRTKGGM